MPEPRQKILSRPQFALTVVMDCQLFRLTNHNQMFRLIQQGIVRTAQLAKKTAKNCGIANHFAKFCRKTKLQMKPKPKVNNVDDTNSEAAANGTSATVGE